MSQASEKFAKIPDSKPQTMRVHVECEGKVLGYIGNDRKRSKECRDFGNGAFVADYDEHGFLIGIEILGPGTAEVELVLPLAEGKPDA